MSRSIQLNIRISPSQMYEIKKLADHFNTTPSTIIRTSISDYIDVFKVWQGRLCVTGYPSSKDSVLEYTRK